MTEEVQKFQNAINAKIATLDGIREGTCWICEEECKNWGGVCIPVDDADALGFGSKDEKTARVVFFPVCEIHDMNSAENVEKVTQVLIIKKTTMSN